MRGATAARLVIGGICLTAPRQVLSLVGGLDRDESDTRPIVRVLGARLVLQAGVDVAVGPRTRVVDVVVDLAHAASMVAAAARWPTHRRTALVSAALAGGTAVLDLAAGRMQRSRSA